MIVQQIVNGLSGLRFESPPDAPGATVAMALVDDLRDGARMTVSGCDLDPNQAYASCIGEAAEFFCQTQPFINPLALDLQPTHERCFEKFEGQIGSEEAWLPAMDILTGETVGVPAPLCQYHPASAHIDVSEGCAAGRSFEHASHHAFCEIIERRARRLWERGAIEPLPVDMPTAAAHWLTRARGEKSVRQVRLFDIAGSEALPVIVAASFDLDGENFACGVKAHNHLAQAIEGALRELLQMEFGLALISYKIREHGKEALVPYEIEQLRTARNVNFEHSIVEPSLGRRLQSSGRLPENATTKDIALYLKNIGQRGLMVAFAASSGFYVVKALLETQEHES